MKKISFGLSVKSIQNAIEEIEDYQRSFNKKVEEFVTELSKYGRIVAMEKVQESPLGKTVTLRCETTPEEMGCKAILIATGELKQAEGHEPFSTLLAIEFGAGIFHNKVPNPKANEMGYGVGTFPGQVHAFEDGWYYLGDDDKWHYTHGVKATMPMYNASVEMAKNAISTGISRMMTSQNMACRFQLVLLEQREYRHHAQSSIQMMLRNTDALQ